MNLDGARKSAELFAPLIAHAAKAKRGRDAFVDQATLDLAMAHVHDEPAATIIQLAAEGDAAAQEAATRAQRWYVTNDMPLPSALREYFLELNGDGASKKKPGLSPHNNGIRNSLICRAISAICAHGFQALEVRERSSKSRRPPSACRILAETLKKHGLHIERSGIEEVWNNHTAN